MVMFSGCPENWQKLPPQGETHVQMSWVGRQRKRDPVPMLLLEHHCVGSCFHPGAIYLHAAIDFLFVAYSWFDLVPVTFIQKIPDYNRREEEDIQEEVTEETEVEDS